MNAAKNSLWLAKREGDWLCFENGDRMPVLSLDEDSPLVEALSPKNNPSDFAQGLRKALDAFDLMRRQHEHVALGLTVEELCPGGLDPTDGIQIAKAFEEAGASLVVASCGTDAFPALKHRRKTQLKQERPEEAFFSPEAWLASAAWLVPHLRIPVLAQGSPENWALAKSLASHLGLKGIVEIN